MFWNQKNFPAQCQYFYLLFEKNPRKCNFVIENHDVEEIWSVIDFLYGRTFAIQEPLKMLAAAKEVILFFSLNSWACFSVLKKFHLM